MCIRITERYAVCNCVYYVHGVDQCSSIGRSGHQVQERVVLVGYACQHHTPMYAAQNGLSRTQGPQYIGGQQQFNGQRLGVLPDHYGQGSGSSTGSSNAGGSGYRY